MRHDECRTQREICIQQQSADHSRDGAPEEAKRRASSRDQGSDYERRQNPQRVGMRRHAEARERERRDEPAVAAALHPAHEGVDRERGARDGEVLCLGARGVPPDVAREGEPERRRERDEPARAKLQRDAVCR